MLKYLIIGLLVDFNNTLIQWGIKTFAYHTNTDLPISFANTNYVILTTAWVDTYEAVTIMPVSKAVSHFYTAQGRGGGNAINNDGSWIAIGQCS